MSAQDPNEKVIFTQRPDEAHLMLGKLLLIVLASALLLSPFALFLRLRKR